MSDLGRDYRVKEVDRLRAELAKVTEERDEARAEWDVWREGCALADKARDAAVQRAADIERATVAGIVAWLLREKDKHVGKNGLNAAGMRSALRLAAADIEAGAWRGKEAP